MSCPPSLLRTLAVYAAAALWVAVLAARAPSFPETVHIDSSFDSGRNRHDWRSARTGTCGPGTSAASARRHGFETLGSRLDGLVDDARFARGAFELRAVSGHSASPNPDECGVFLYALLHADEGAPINGGPPQGDVDLTVRFRPLTESSVLTVLLAFGDRRWRYVALMIPSSGISAVPYTERGRIALMEPRADLQGDNAPLRPGVPASLRVRYHAASETVAVFLEDRRLVFSRVLGGGPHPVLVPERAHAVDDYPGARLVPRPAALLSVYSEAQLDANADSRVEMLSVRLASRKQAPARAAVDRLASRIARPFVTAEFRFRCLLGRLRRKASVLAAR